MKVYLDDLRTPPWEWEDYPDIVVCRSYDTCIALLKTGMVTELDLDYNIEAFGGHTGMDVLHWIYEKRAFDKQFRLPDLYVHSGDPVGSKKMADFILHINKTFKKGKSHVRPIQLRRDSRRQILPQSVEFPHWDPE